VILITRFPLHRDDKGQGSAAMLTANDVTRMASVKTGTGTGMPGLAEPLRPPPLMQGGRGERSQDRQRTTDESVVWPRHPTVSSLDAGGTRMLTSSSA